MNPAIYQRDDTAGQAEFMPGMFGWVSVWVIVGKSSHLINNVKNDRKKYIFISTNPKKGIKKKEITRQSNGNFKAKCSRRK